MTAAACAAEVAQECSVPPGELPALEPRDGPAPATPDICVILPPDPDDGRADDLLVHGEWLALNGFRVEFRSHGERLREGSSPTTWTVVPWGESLTDDLPACDVVVVATAGQGARARALGVAPVVHLEQGDAGGAVLARHLRTLAAQRITPSSQVEDWSLGVRALTFDGGPAALAELTRRLVTLNTGAVAVPVSRPAFEGHRLVRWTVVARRKGAAGTTRIALPARSENPDRRHPWQEGIKALAWQRPEQAVRFFVTANRNATEEQAALLWRWVALSALESGRRDDALDGVTSALDTWPDHPDYHYLAAVMALLSGQAADVEGALRNVRALGTPYRYDEWFEDTAGLLSRRLSPVSLAYPA